MCTEEISAIKLIGGLLLFFFGMLLAAIGFFFYFVGGICGSVAEGLYLGMGGTLLVCMGCLLIYRSAASEAG